MKTNQTQRRIARFGRMQVWERLPACNHLRPYFVENTFTGRWLESFAKQADAIEWAKANANG